MKRILISGGGGEFAKELQKHNTKYEITAPLRSEMDITKIDSLDYNIFSKRPDYFIHAGALTRPMVIHEDEPDESIKTNIIGTKMTLTLVIKADLLGVVSISPKF